MSKPEAILVVPNLRIQNANAISSPMTHGFPSITAFTGLMWAFERKLVQAGVCLRLHAVGVVCHHQQEQVTQGYVRSFNLTRNPVDKDGTTAAIVEEGRMHMQISLIFAVSEKREPGSPAFLMQGNETQMGEWARQAGEILSGMRVAGGSVLPVLPIPGRRVRPWMAIVPEEPDAAASEFRKWRRQWLPGFALVGRDDLLSQRLQHLRIAQPEATLLDAWLHSSRFNYEPVASENGSFAPEGQVAWADPMRKKGSGWIVPIPVGYTALNTQTYPAGSVRNARNESTPFRFVESIYSLGEWISPHRLNELGQLLWHTKTDESHGIYRCVNRYKPPHEETTGAIQSRDGDVIDEWDDDEAYDYT